MGEVITIPAKQDHLRHRATSFTLTYLPDRKKWQWEFYVVSRTRLFGVENTYEQAQLVAKTHIDLASGA